MILLQCLRTGKLLLKTRQGERSRSLKIRNGLEFVESDFKEFCSTHGIARHHTVPGKPQQNGVAERINQTLIERAHCMLSNAGLWSKRHLWAEAASTACYLVNRSPHSSIDFKIPEEVWLVEGNGGIKQKNAVDGQGRNRKALNDIGNVVKIRDAEGKPQRPITRSFGAKLLANAQVAGDNKTKKAAPGVPVPKPVARKVIVAKPKPVEVIEISPDTKEDDHKKQEKVVPQIEKSAAYKKKKKKVSMTSVLTARSKAACGLSKKPKEAVVDIDASDADNELAVVEYVEDIYIFYKLAENECRPQDYMDSQPEINEKMRAILVDWLIEVHNRFDLLPETLYLTINLVDRFLSMKAVRKRELQLVGIGAMLIACKYEEIWAPEVNDFVTISESAYSNDQILKMEKAILGMLEWYITVPTPYVFLSRYIKASIPDLELENLVYFLAELALMNYGCVSFCPSMVAASAVYVARHSLFKTPVWTDTLTSYTGFSELQLSECAKMLVNLHSVAPGHRLQTVYKKYSKPERCAVAFCSPAKSLLGSS